jgi:hypothetical protein
MMIDSAYPATGGNLFLSVLLPFKALHLQDDLELAPIFAAPANEIVRAILVSRALPFIGDGEVEMVVAGISDHFRHPLQLICHAVLPLWRVEHDVADMAFGCAHTGAHSAEKHLRRGPNRAKALDDGQNGRFPGFRVRLDGLGQPLNYPLLVLEEGDLLQRYV